MVPGGGAGTPDAQRLPVSMGKSHAGKDIRMDSQNHTANRNGKSHPSKPLVVSTTQYNG
jgi:hypothetical protein